MPRCRAVSFVCAMALAVAAPAAAQVASPGWTPRTGDAWVDAWLGDMNAYAHRYRDPFIDEVVRYQGAPRPLVDELLVRRRWAPADVYYACAIAREVGRPCDAVADDWQQHRDQGWGMVAQRQGIRPGSPEFRRLKRGLVPTYDRWARPILLDPELQRIYPNRGKAADPGVRPSGEGPAAPKAGPPRSGDARAARTKPRDKADATPR